MTTTSGTSAPMTVALLHPGRMGAGFGAELVARGHRVVWCSAGRSPATRARAEAAGFVEVRDPAGLAQAQVALSICDPAGAEPVARTVAGSGFQGLYVEANAGTPERMRAIADSLDMRVVDGCVIGSPPPASPGPRLHLAGSVADVDQVQALFAGTGVRTRHIPGAVGAASAMKLAYAAYQKTSYVLAVLALSFADEHGVRDALLGEAALMDGPALVEVGANDKVAASIAARAWRWGPELADCASALDAGGLPTGFAAAAAEALSRWNVLKDRFDVGWPELEDALRATPVPALSGDAL